MNVNESSLNDGEHMEKDTVDSSVECEGVF